VREKKRLKEKETKKWGEVCGGIERQRWEEGSGGMER